MPSAAPRFCPAPGCPVLTNGGRCQAHRRARHAAIDARRGSPSARLYDRTWQLLRKLKLATDPWCEIKTHCATLPLIQQLASEVDHIQTVRDHPELRLVWSNLRSACKRCHSARTMRDQVHPKEAASR
jgi:5-methylcytosine-specific restriction enzyme A